MARVILDEIEEKAYSDFCKKHKDCCRKKTGRPIASPIGGGFSLIVTPTGIGDCVSVRCNACGEVEDITNVDNW